VKATHRPDLRCWSRFDEARDLDFHSWAWLRAGGTVLIDPLPLSEHDRAQLEAAGPVSHVVVTNSDHLRAGPELADRFGAELVGPAAERGALGAEAARWLRTGDQVVEGLVAVELSGSKTPGELALLLEGTTLITGDLIRGHAGGALNLLPDPKLSDRAAAVRSVRELLVHKQIEAVLVGDGWPVFRDGYARLEELVAALEA
jgi:hypothetical protein